MRIELVTADGYCYRLDSDNPEIVGKWFAEHMPVITMHVGSMPPARLWVYPTGEYDSRQWSQPALLTVERLQWLSDKFFEWAKEDYDPKVRIE